MKITVRKIIILGFLSWVLTMCIKAQSSSIVSGVSWFDQNYNEVNAHGACIVKEDDTYYLFGEHKSDTSNMFTGFACYSSSNLADWKFENIVLPVQKEGLLGPNRVGERVKVMKCPKTGEFVMYMHCDDMGYKDPHVGYATCNSINGDYEFKGDLLHDGKYLKKWDLGTFQDFDNKGYLLTHEGFIYELSDDYKSVKRVVANNIAPGGESPAMFKQNGYYFWLFSNKTSWERNDNYYFVATSLDGTWTKKDLFAPEESLTWNSQCSFVLPIIAGADTLNLYMGDRWSFPKQGSAATQIWQPIQVNDNDMSIPNFYEVWSVDTQTAKWNATKLAMTPVKNIARKGNWLQKKKEYKSKEKGATLSCNIRGEQIAIRGMTNNKSGYATFRIINAKGEEILNTIVDFYSKNPSESLRFVSPKMKYGNYKLIIEPMGEFPKWSDKRISDYGSTDAFITVTNILYR